MPSSKGSSLLFIARWDGYVPLDQTDLTSGQDGSSEAMEDGSRRGAKTLTRGAPADARVGLAGPTCPPLPLSHPSFKKTRPESSYVCSGSPHIQQKNRNIRNNIIYIAEYIYNNTYNYQSMQKQ